MTKPVISITITGETREEVGELLFEFAQAFGGAGIDAVVPTDDGKRASVDLKATEEEPKAKAKRKTTRTKPKADDQKADDADDKADDKADGADGLVEDMTAKQAREAGTVEAQAYFAQKPQAITEITAIQTKFGVRKFDEIPDDKAHEFLADVRLMTAGATTGDA